MSQNLVIKQNTNVISYQLEKILKQFSNRSRNFRKITNEKISKIINHINLSKVLRHKIDITPRNIETFKSIINAYIKDKVINNYRNMLINKWNIIDKYNKGVSVIELSRQYNIGPLSIFRLILSEGYSKSVIKSIIKNVNNNKNETKLNKHDIIQLNLALQNDDVSSIDQTMQLKQSLAYERYIQKLLDDNNVKYATQEELINKSKLTPDFLILSKLSINGHPIKWIDAKNFFGANTRMYNIKLRKQAHKYNKAFGPGAYFFKYGFSSKLSFNNTFLLTYY